MMESPQTIIPNDITSSSQVPYTVNLPPVSAVSTTTQEIQEALEITRETRIEIIVLKDIKVMVFNKKYANKFIIIYP